MVMEKPFWNANRPTHRSFLLPLPLAPVVQSHTFLHPCDFPSSSRLGETTCSYYYAFSGVLRGRLIKVMF